MLKAGVSLELLKRSDDALIFYQYVMGHFDKNHRATTEARSRFVHLVQVMAKDKADQAKSVAIKFFWTFVIIFIILNINL